MLEGKAKAWSSLQEMVSFRDASGSECCGRSCSLQEARLNTQSGKKKKGSPIKLFGEPSSYLDANKLSSEGEPCTHLDGAVSTVFAVDPAKRRLIGGISSVRVVDSGSVEDIPDIHPNFKHGTLPELEVRSFDQGEILTPGREAA